MEIWGDLLEDSWGSYRLIYQEGFGWIKLCILRVAWKFHEIIDLDDSCGLQYQVSSDHEFNLHATCCMHVACILHAPHQCIIWFTPIYIIYIYNMGGKWVEKWQLIKHGDLDGLGHTCWPGWYCGICVFDRGIDPCRRHGSTILACHPKGSSLPKEVSTPHIPIKQTDLIDSYVETYFEIIYSLYNNI